MTAACKKRLTFCGTSSVQRRDTLAKDVEELKLRVITEVDAASRVRRPLRGASRGVGTAEDAKEASATAATEFPLEAPGGGEGGDEHREVRGPPQQIRGGAATNNPPCPL